MFCNLINNILKQGNEYNEFKPICNDCFKFNLKQCLKCLKKYHLKNCFETDNIERSYCKDCRTIAVYKIPAG